MKTPREILFQKHQAAEPKLDALRSDVLHGSVRAAESRAVSASASDVPFLVKAWIELVWAPRKTWAGFAFLWVMIWLINVNSAPTPTMMAQQTKPIPEVLMAVREHRRLLSELMAAPVAQAAERPRRLPQPRSEMRCETKIV